MSDFETVLHYPLVHLKGGEITVASILLSAAIPFPQRDVHLRTAADAKAVNGVIR